MLLVISHRTSPLPASPDSLLDQPVLTYRLINLWFVYIDCPLCVAYDETFNIIMSENWHFETVCFSIKTVLLKNSTFLQIMSVISNACEPLFNVIRQVLLHVNARK